jgi:hypothetical protein
VSQATTTSALMIAVQAGIPVLLWGAPGTGKSSMVTAASAALGLDCETVLASIREPSDFAGLPVVIDGRVCFAPPSWAERLASQGRGVLFLDEISTAPPAVQAALLRVVLDRVVGDLALPADVVIVAAANPPDQAADGWELSAPLANRFCHLAWREDVDAFTAGTLGAWPVPMPVRARGELGAHVAEANGLLVGFLRARPQLLCVVPKSAAAAGQAFPTPRTWSMASRLWAVANAGGACQQARAELVCGAVGDGAGYEFLTYAAEVDLPDPEVLLRNPDAGVLPHRGDQRLAVLGSVTARVLADNTPERWSAGWRVLARAAADTPDVAAVCAKLLAEHRPPGGRAPTELKIFAPVLRGAGLLST